MAEGAEAAEAEDGAPAPKPVILEPGQVIQGHEIIKPLGKGKFSIVYMAKRLSDGLICALKKINIFDMMVPKQREKCLKEVRLLQSLDHPNIVKLLNSLIDNNELLIIVEWAEKGDLKRMIRKALANNTKFKENEIWEYSRQLAGALDHMHRKRIMHRDLKPANIFVSMDGSLKLGDLGLGRFFSSQTLEAFSKVGTPLYMSPEVLHGAGYDMRSDVWSLGCVIYELAMLRSPFKSDQQLSLYDLFVRISKGQYPPLPETSSPEFVGLVNQMLQLDPTKRLESSQVLEVCNARAKHMAALKASTASPSPGPSSKHKEVSPKQPAPHFEGTQQPPPKHPLPQQPPPQPPPSKQQQQQQAQQQQQQQQQQHVQAAAVPPCRPSPLLVMDDIIEKLKILDCEDSFLLPRGLPILHRCFFTQPLPTGKLSQFEVMHELMHWLLGMLEERDNRARQQVPAADASAGPCLAPSRGSAPSGGVGAGDAAAGGGGVHSPGRGHLFRRHTRGGDTAALIKEIIASLKGRGIQISSDATLTQLSQGHGEGVVLIINELVNQELMGRDFHFEQPVWGCKPVEGRCGEEVLLQEDVVDEEADSSLELGSRDRSVGSDAESDAAPLASGSTSADYLRNEVPAGQGPPLLEPVHVAHVDCAVWREELERVKPSLRVVVDLPPSDWRSSIRTAQRLCQQVQGLGLQSFIPDSVHTCCRQWRDELSRLQIHEDRLNETFSDQVARIVELRDARVPQTERLAELQTSVSENSNRLASLAQELEHIKAEISSKSDASLDPERLPRMRKAVLRLLKEEQQLEVRIQLVQRELSMRSASR